jgi:hypothetical protein
MSDQDDIVTVYTVRDEMEGEIIKNALEAEGIKCIAGDEHMFTGAFDLRIQVLESNAVRAKEIIDSHLEKD